MLSQTPGSDSVDCAWAYILLATLLVLWMAGCCDTMLYCQMFAVNSLSIAFEDTQTIVC